MSHERRPLIYHALTGYRGRGGGGAGEGHSAAAGDLASQSLQAGAVTGHRVESKAYLCQSDVEAMSARGKDMSQRAGLRVKRGWRGQGIGGITEEIRGSACTEMLGKRVHGCLWVVWLPRTSISARRLVYCVCCARCDALSTAVAASGYRACFRVFQGVSLSLSEASTRPETAQRQSTNVGPLVLLHNM